MEAESNVNGQEVSVDGVNQRTPLLNKDMLFRHVQSIIPRHGKRLRMEGKIVHTRFPGEAVINAVGFGDKFLIQTNVSVYIIDI
jgi:hypothetical protein